MLRQTEHRLVREVGMLAAGMSLAGLVLTNSPATATVTVPSKVTVHSFNSSFSAMSKLKPVTAAGHGLVGVILPDETSSTRYVNFDAPYLKKAFQLAGYTNNEFQIQNALGVDATELADAQSFISQGAKVVIFDPIDSTVGAEVQRTLTSHGVIAISYDRATFVGKSTYYVSFDNFKVGQLIGQGFKSCVTAWKVKNPRVFELDGDEDIEADATSFAKGYNSVIWGKAQTSLKAGTTNALGYKLVGRQITPGRTNAKGQTIFQQQYAAHKNINATVEANDAVAQAVITDLKNAGVGPKKITTTGQDSTFQAMVNILQGYQCSSVYKAVYKEAQDAVALATILRAGAKPAGLLNATTTPPKGVAGNKQPASLLTPVWVSSSNMKSTVIADKFINAQALCNAAGKAKCSAAGIKS